MRAIGQLEKKREEEREEMSGQWASGQIERVRPQVTDQPKEKSPSVEKERKGKAEGERAGHARDHGKRRKQVLGPRVLTPHSKRKRGSTP